MKLSYIIPVYNVEKYLRQCIDSILGQTMDDYEIILIDDESPDGCPAICDEYKEKYPEIFKVIHKKNGGPSAARNLGIELAEGEYLLFMDSDDYLAEDRIAEIYKTAKENRLDILHNSYYWKDDNTGADGKDPLIVEANKVLSHSDMEKVICYGTTKKVIPYMWRNLYRREFLIKNRIKLDEKLRMVEDPPFNIWAFGVSERFMAADMPFYCHRLREDSLQSRKYIPDYDKWMYYQWNLKMEYYGRFYDSNPEFYEDLARYTLNVVLLFLLGNVYKNGVKDRYRILRRIGNSEMLRRSFKDYDMNKYKSKSLDWWMTWCVKHRLYHAAHLLCEKILFKRG